MTIHKEGFPILLPLLVALVLINSFLFFWVDCSLVWILSSFVSLVIFSFFLQFFRSPRRIPVIDDNIILCPADGKVVVIEKHFENEYFKQERLQVSIFMSPMNVHINWTPVKGLLKYYRYHKGKFLVAWEPKSSTDNERNTTVVQRPDGTEVLFRQIAGAVARRIVFYPKEGDNLEQGQQFGFIKFGSRVDLFLPLDVELNVNIGDKVVGRQTIIGKFNTAK